MNSKKSASAASSEERYFHSFDGSDIRVTHPDGTAAVVGATPRNLPKKLWRQAVKAGCQTDTSMKPVDMPGLTQADDAFTRMEAIKGAMMEALQSDETDPKFADAFTAADIPNVRWLEKRLGFGLSADERDQAWAEVQAGLDESGDGENEGEDE